MSDHTQTIEPSVVFPLDDNTFIFNGKARSPLKLTSASAVQGPPAEEVRPNDLPEDQRGQNAHRLWAGVGLWAFITLAAVLAIPVGVGSLMLATRVKPTVTFPALATAIAPIMIAAPSPNVIDELHRFADAVTLPSASPPPREISPPLNVIDGTVHFPTRIIFSRNYLMHRKISRSRADQITSHPRVASKPEEPPRAPIGCPPSVCFPWKQ